MGFHVFVFVSALVAGAVAAVTGFGIGSLLTPVMGLMAGTRVAVAAVAVPHLIGTAIRFWRLRDRLDARVLWRFGVPSAAGGLTGALLHGTVSSPELTIVFGGVLLFVAVSELTGLGRHMRFSGGIAWFAGVVSGFLGGLVGNQGGIRSAALLGFDLHKHAFVATATAVGLVVDGARLPIYLLTAGRDVVNLWPTVAVATVGVTIGTLFGGRLLARIPETMFRQFVAVILFALGLALLLQGIRAR